MISKQILVSAILIMLARRRKLRRFHSRKPRRYWVKQWLKNRKAQGAYHQLMKELSLMDTSSYKNFVRMDAATFEELLKMVGPRIHHKDTIMRQAITPGERLAITLRFLATGETYESLKFLYRVSAQSLGQIIPETCCAIGKVLKEKYLRVPSNETEWISIAETFESRWNFPKCVGAMDGKHILIQPPRNSGSYYYNYKKGFSIVLLAIVDADYNFIYVDIGCNGRISDGGVLRNSSLFRALEDNSLNIPKADMLPGTQELFPYVLVADEAFPLKENILKPYSQRGLTPDKRIYNYRLSRARRVVENAFGILANRFRIFRSPIILNPEKVEAITFACCALHNFLRSRKEACAMYMPHGYVDSENPETHAIQEGEWHNGPNSLGIARLKRGTANKHSQNAKETRDRLCKYFSSTDGEVPWQWTIT